MALRFVLAAAVTGMALAAPAAEATAVEPSPAAGAAKKKGKAKKKCKRGKVPLTVNGRRRCVPASAALPKPRAGDPRAAIITEALTPDIAKIPDPKDKLPPPMEQVYRKLGPKALKGTEQSVRIALDRLDGLAAGRVGRPGLATASAESGNSFSKQFGNVTVDARLSIATVGSELVGNVEWGVTTDRGDGTTVRVSTEVPLRLSQIGFRSPGCPTVEGKLDAKDGIGITVRTEVRSNEGKTLDEFFITEVVDETEMQGIVGDDAKLDTLEIRSIQEITEHAGGSAFGGSTVNGSIVRNTVVNMRTGEYEPHVSLVNVGVKLSGILNVFAPFVRPLVAERLKRAADKDFASSVDVEMENYRELETAWNEPNKCAKLKFDKADEALTLARGESGDETVRVEARDGGAPAKADWTVTGQENGAFSLNSHGANPTTFHYEATRVGKGVKVKGTFKAVSKAGVAEKSWTQKTKEDPINEITGSFGGELSGETANHVPSRQLWTGVATFHRLTYEGGANGLYILTSGNVSIDLSGTEQSGATGCLQTGSAHEPVTGGSLTVTGTGPTMEAPYRYSVDVSMPFVAIHATRHDCPEAAQEEYEGSEFETTPVWKLNREDEESADGLAYVGADKTFFGSPPFVSFYEENWALHGKP